MAQVTYKQYTIIKESNGAIKLEENGSEIESVLPVLKEIAKELGVEVAYSTGAPLNTRQLGSRLISVIKKGNNNGDSGSSDSGMSVQEAVDVINDEIMTLEDTDEALTWDDEVYIKKQIVSICELESVFADEDALENIYTYEMFDKTQYDISTDQQIEMIKAWLSELDEYGIYPDLDVNSIK